MIDPQVRSAILGKRLLDIEECGSFLILHFDDGGEFLIRSDWDEDPETLDPTPRAPVVDFVLYGHKTSSDT